MSYLDFHKKRMKLNYQNDDVRNGFLDNSTDYINKTFSQSPLYKKVKIDNEEIEVRVVEDKLQKSNTFYEQKQLIFKPNTVVNNGAYVEIVNDITKKNEIWLLMYYVPNVLTPKGIIRYCNKSIQVKEKEFPCVVTASVSANSELIKNNELVLPKGHLLIYVQSTNETQQILENDRFIFDGNAYEVQTIDNVTHTENNIGFITLTVKKVPKTYEEALNSGKDYNYNITIDKVKETTDNSGDIWGGW